MYNWNILNFEEIIKESNSYSDVLRKLNIPIAGGNISTLRKKIQEKNIDISHFTFKNYLFHKNIYKDSKYYLYNGSNISTYKLKKKLIRDGIKENKCEQCGCSTWQGHILNIQLHHIDGNPQNNELSNLKMLCPNCHSITDNYCGAANKNIKKHHNYCKDCGEEIGLTSTYCLLCEKKTLEKSGLAI